MTPEAAADLADRIYAAISRGEELNEGRIGSDRVAADRQRIVSDLAGLRLLDEEFRGCVRAESYDALRDLFVTDLRRTAGLYGVDA